MNMQPPNTALEAEQIVACAIFCCDRKEYPLKRRANNKDCQRLGNKKHSCVLHQLREKKGGKLTQTNRFSLPDGTPLQASPRFKIPGIKRTLIPDIKIGDQIIDAKFPCDPASVEAARAGRKSPFTGQFKSRIATGPDMIGDKELKDYQAIAPSGPEPKAITPKDAETKKGDCSCKTLQ